MGFTPDKYEFEFNSKLCDSRAEGLWQVTYFSDPEGPYLWNETGKSILQGRAAVEIKWDNKKNETQHTAQAEEMVGKY